MAGDLETRIAELEDLFLARIAELEDEVDRQRLEAAGLRETVRKLRRQVEALERKKQSTGTDELAALADDVRLTRADLRRLLDCSDRTIARMIADGRLPPPFRDGGQRWLAGAVRDRYRERQAQVQEERVKVEDRRLRRWSRASRLPA